MQPSQHIDPVFIVLGVIIALGFGFLTYVGRRAPKAPTLVAPPPEIHIDPDNIPQLKEEDEPKVRRWNAADATVPMGVPLKPRQ